jgi:hypothetical protein
MERAPDEYIMERVDTKDISWKGWIQRIYHGKGGYKGYVMERMDTKYMAWRGWIRRICHGG